MIEANAAESAADWAPAVSCREPPIVAGRVCTCCRRAALQVMPLGVDGEHGSGRSRAEGCCAHRCPGPGVVRLRRPPPGRQRRPNKASAACGPLSISLSNATPGLGGDQDPSAERPRDIPACQDPLVLRPMSTCRPSTADALRTLSLPLPNPAIIQAPDCDPSRTRLRRTTGPPAFRCTDSLWSTQLHASTTRQTCEVCTDSLFCHSHDRSCPLRIAWAFLPPSPAAPSCRCHQTRG
jgi:hypothetical protein